MDESLDTVKFSFSSLIGESEKKIVPKNKKLNTFVTRNLYGTRNLYQLTFRNNDGTIQTKAKEEDDAENGSKDKFKILIVDD